MKNYKEMLERASQLRVQSEVTYIDAYLRKIGDLVSKGRYEMLPNIERTELFSQIEKIANRLEEPAKDGFFDPVIAKRARAAAGFSLQKKLAEHLGLSNGAVSRFESGKYNLQRTKMPVNESALKYIGWLKEQGYNPFNL